MSGNNIMQGQGTFLGARMAQSQVLNPLMQGASSQRMLPTSQGNVDLRALPLVPQSFISPNQPGNPFAQTNCCHPVSDQQSTIQMLMGLVYNLVQMMSELMSGMMNRMIGGGGSASGVPVGVPSLGAQAPVQAKPPSFLDKISDFFSSAGSIYNTIKDTFFGGDKTTSETGEKASGWSIPWGEILGLGAGALLTRGAGTVFGGVKKGASWLWNKGKDIVSSGVSWLGGLFS